MKKTSPGIRPFILILLALAAVTLIIRLNERAANTTIITYNDMLTMVADGKVSALAIQGEKVYGLVYGSATTESTFPQRYDFSTTSGDNLIATLRTMAAAQGGSTLSADQISEANLAFGGKPLKIIYLASPQTPWILEWMPLLLCVLMMVCFWWLMFRQQSGGGNNRVMNFGKSNATMSDPAKNKIRFADVAGAEEEKEELREIVDFLNNPERYRSLGARIPKGILLVGPPGTGKTLLAKAVAGEANVPFFSISGSDFVEMFVGVGASRVRDLFEQAKQNAPSIVFIDEIDAVGRHRGAGLGGGHDEREQTLNQLLVEMDGFTGNEGVIVIAATNRKDILDPALLRPGRFDRQITVHYPDMDGRLAILKVHARGKKLEENVDLVNIAQRTPFSTGADLENIMNEAALLAARERKNAVSQDMLIEAVEKTQMGPEKKSHKVLEEDRKLVAYHEAGHALAAYYLPLCDNVHKITVIPRGGAGGYTLSLPEKELDNVSRAKLLQNISLALGGHAAEKLVFNDVYTGAQSDLKRATQLCRAMITQYGMSDTLGTVFYDEQQEVFVGASFGQSRSYSEKIAAMIDDEVRATIAACYHTTEEILREHQDKLEGLANLLIEKETVEKSEFEVFMKE